MVHAIYSIKSHLAFGSTAIGLCLIALGVTRILNPNSWVMFCAAICLLIITSWSLFISFSPRHEKPDEMSVAHDGLAAGHALRITLITAGLTCMASMIAKVTFDFTAASLGLIGIGLVTYGAVFAWLER